MTTTTTTQLIAPPCTFPHCHADAVAQVFAADFHGVACLKHTYAANRTPTELGHKGRSWTAR